MDPSAYPEKATVKLHFLSSEIASSTQKKS